MLAAAAGIRVRAAGAAQRRSDSEVPRLPVDCRRPGMPVTRTRSDGPHWQFKVATVLGGCRAGPWRPAARPLSLRLGVLPVLPGGTGRPGARRSSAPITGRTWTPTDSKSRPRPAVAEEIRSPPAPSECRALAP